MKVKIREIADQLGLSVSTVSRALNDHSAISKETKEMVRQKAVEMGYFQNSLRIMEGINKSPRRLIGVCVPNLSNPICIDVIRGAEEYFLIRDYNLIIMDSKESIDQEEKNVKVLREMRVEGLIIFPTSVKTSERIKQITEGITSTVYVCNVAEDRMIHSIGIDEEQAFKNLTEYLIQMGHKKIVFVGGSAKFHNRVRGFKNTMEEHSNHPVIINCEPTQQDGFRNVKNMIDNHTDFTAIVAASDFLALGAMDAIYECSKKVPEDYSLVGLDNISFSGSRRINLTTMNQPGKSIGKKAGEIIYHEIVKGPYGFKHTKLFDTYLVIRDSCRSNKN